jgi:hypothetical protein
VASTAPAGAAPRVTSSSIAPITDAQDASNPAAASAIKPVAMSNPAASAIPALPGKKCVLHH